MGKVKMYVRLKPYNKNRGHVLRRYSYRSTRFYEGRWYKVDESLAQQLSGLHQQHHNPDSPLAFDVATEAQALSIEAEERRREEEEMRRVHNAEVLAAKEVSSREVSGVLTTEDLPDVDDQELGVSMKNTKDELADVADSMGIETDGLSKRQLLDAIEDVANSEE